MLSNPSIAIEIGSIEVDDGIVVEDIGSNGPVAVPGKVVNQKLYRHDDVIENKRTCIYTIRNDRLTKLFTSGSPKTSVKKRITLSLG